MGSLALVKGEEIVLMFDPAVVAATAEALARMEEMRLCPDEIFEQHMRGDGWGAEDNYEENLLSLEQGKGDIYSCWTAAGIEAFTSAGRGATFIVDASEETPLVPGTS